MDGSFYYIYVAVFNNFITFSGVEIDVRFFPVHDLGAYNFGNVRAEKSCNSNNLTSVKVAPPQRKSTIYYSSEFWAFLGTNKNSWAPLLFTENQIPCGGASLHKASCVVLMDFNRRMRSSNVQGFASKVLRLYEEEEK